MRLHPFGHRPVHRDRLHADAVGDASGFQGGKAVSRAKANEEVTIQISAKDNYRVSGVQWKYEGSGDNIWLPNTNGDTTNKTWTVKITKHANWDTVRVVFEEYTEYTEIGAYQYREDNRDTALYNPRSIEFRNAPKQASKIKVGAPIEFQVVKTRTGYSVNEVWVKGKKDGADYYKMLSPTVEGGDTYRYTVTKYDKGQTIQFIAVQVGTEPKHNIIPEYTIGNTGITNVGSEKLYTIYVNDVKKAEVGPIYGMGAKLTVNDVDINQKTAVKVKVEIPKASHEYVGAGTVLIYQVDTVSIRFNDYILDNYKVLQDGESSFVYEFWYNELTDLNIMVNFKEIGTKEIKGTDPVAKTPISVNVGGQTVNQETAEHHGRNTVTRDTENKQRDHSSTDRSVVCRLSCDDTVRASLTEFIRMFGHILGCYICEHTGRGTADTGKNTDTCSDKCRS